MATRSFLSLAMSTAIFAAFFLPLTVSAGRSCFNDNDCNKFPCGATKCGNKKWWLLGLGECLLKRFPEGTPCATFPDQPCAPVAVCDGTNHATCPAPAPVADGTVCGNATDRCRSSDVCRAGSCVAGAPLPVGSVCRAAVGTCDVAEVCVATGAVEDGVAVTQCANDTVKPAGVECALVRNPCAPLAFCDGASGVCPAPTPLADGTVCGQSFNPCRRDSTCFSGRCAIGAFLPVGTVCRASRGDCDVEDTCTTAPNVIFGGETQCLDNLLSLRSVCRPANTTRVNGQCDVAERCTGLLPFCPPDVWRSC